MDYEHPVIRLSSLSQEDFLVLLQKIQHVFAYGDDARYLLPDEALSAFMSHCQQRIGDAYFRTPRTTITAFVNLLAVLEQNPGTDWKSLLGEVTVTKDEGGAADHALETETDAATPTGANSDDEFAKFKL